jgi:hypothetical protein
LNASGYAPDTKSFTYLPFYEPEEVPLTPKPSNTKFDYNTTFNYNPATRQCDCDGCIDARARGALAAQDAASAPPLLELDPTHLHVSDPTPKAEYEWGAVVTMHIPAVLPTDPAARKDIPIATGVLDYFPAALAEIARLSKQGNDQHNPGEPLHWARGKSNDHADTIIRHFLERGTIDTDGMRHSAKLAWRALALLQMEMEAEGAPVARGAR